MPFTDPAKQREAHKRWYEANREKRQAQIRAWQVNNREKCVKNTQRYNAKDPDRRRNYVLKSLYGITLDDYNALLASQDYKCALCEIDAKDARDGRLVVDHMHCSGKVRALLCHKCNSALGMLRDDPDLIYKAAIYVRKHKVTRH